MIAKNDTIKTLFVNEFELFMKKINQWDDFVSNNCKCKFCGDIISQSNLHALIPTNNHIEYCCSRPICISKFSEEELYGSNKSGK